jgi:hypothetical protein
MNLRFTRILIMMPFLFAHVEAYSSPDESARAIQNAYRNYKIRMFERSYLNNLKAAIVGGETIANKISSDFNSQLRLDFRSYERLEGLPNDLIEMIALNLTPKEFSKFARLCAQFREISVSSEDLKSQVVENGKREESLLLNHELSEHFVKIPSGLLPGRIMVQEFEMDRYPVTRDFWQRTMGNLPAHFSASQDFVTDSVLAPTGPDIELFLSCPDCPVTYVNWTTRSGAPDEVQEFLSRLNAKVAYSGCTYDLPTEEQLMYAMRGDVTGQNTDPYSSGVTINNRLDYITCRENAQDSIQPNGRKLRNSFGIELGNVERMSKSPFSPSFTGRFALGGAWNEEGRSAELIYRGTETPGVYSPGIGISLIRKCK